MRSLDAITGLGNQLSDNDKLIIRSILKDNKLLDSQEVIEAYTEQVNDSINKLKSMLTLLVLFINTLVKEELIN